LFQLATATEMTARLLSVLLPLPIGLAFIAYTPFVAIAPFICLALYQLAGTYPAFSRTAFWSGCGLTLMLLMLVVERILSTDYAGALSFLNNEVVYTNAERAMGHAVRLFYGIAPGTLAGLAIAAVGIGLRIRRAGGEELSERWVVVSYIA